MVSCRTKINYIQLMNSPATSKNSALSKIDTVGACLSFACAIHCMAMPFIITALPLLGLGALGHSSVEMVLFTVTIGLASISLCWGTRVHKQWKVLCLLAAALILFWLAGFGAHSPEEGLLVGFGGLCLAAGHLLNRKLCRSCHHCCDRH